MDTNTDSLTRSGSREIKDAIEDLFKSCGFQDANVVHTVSDTLLHCNFHSEDGKLHVINNLQRLSGTTVVKRICEGLSKLSRAYPDSKQFEEEAIKLVVLCCSQSEALMQNGCKDGCQLASPLDIIDWTIELCDELMTPKEGIYHINQSITLSSYLSKVRKIYELLRNARLVILLINQDGRIEMRDPFKSLFQALKPRIHFDTFDELLDQAIFIIQADELLDPKMLSKIHTKKDSLLLKNWISILNMSFLSNWFGVAIAKHDFLVHNETFARKQPFSDERTYDESLICSVCNALNNSINNNQDFKLTCDEARLRLTFLPEHSEVLLRYPSLCFELLQSEVRIDQIQEVLELLQIKRDDTLLPVISNTESEKLELKLKVFQQSLLSGNLMRLDEFLGAGNSRQLTSASQARNQQGIICSVVFKALIDLPGDREQLVDVLRMWRDRFPNDNSHTMLFAIIYLVECLKQQGTHNGMRKLKAFLTQLSTEHLDAFPSWPLIVEGLITALPTTWFTQECNLINCILNKFRESTDPRDVITFKVQSIKNFVKSLAAMQVSEQVKRKAIKIGLDLFDYTTQKRHYELMLNVIMFVASDLSSGKIRKYVSDLLKAVCQVEVHYSQVWNVVRLIHTSSSIEDKGEILLCFLKVLEDAKGKGDIEEKMSACAGFFRFPVDSANAKRFLQQAALERTIYNSILYYLSINESTLDRDNNFNVHFEFLLNAILNSKMEHRDLLFMTVKSNIQWLYYPSVEIFEVIMTCIAGSLAVGSFNQESNNEVLRLLHAAVRTHQLSAPNDVLSLYIVLIQGIRKVSCLGHNGSCTKSFAEGIDLIIKLPLPFLQLKLLIHSMANILEEGRFSKEEEVTNIMFHLFKLPRSKCSFTDPNVLASHFNRLTSKSHSLLMASRLSQLSIHRRIGKSEIGSNSLMELFMTKIPTAFEDGSSVDLFVFVNEEFFKEPPASLQVSLPLIDKAIKEAVSVEAFKAKIKEIAQKIPYIPPEQVKVLVECILEFYALEMDEKLDVYDFIEVLLSLNWNMFDMRRMYGNLIPLSIPKHLVSVLKGKRSLKEIIPKLYRILDVASNLNPSITLSVTPHEKDSGNQILELLGHDLNMLLNHTCLRSSDVCLALLLYKNCHIMEVLSVFLHKDKVSLKDDNEWPLRYDQTKLLTPGKLAYLILRQLRRLGVAEMKTELNKICCKLVKNYNHDDPRICTNQQLANKFEEYFELFIRIMDESTTLAEVRHWLDEFSAEHALQCKNVIMAACSWKAGRRTFQEATQMNEKASATLSKLLNRPVSSAVNAARNNDLASKLDIMVNVIKKIEDVQIVGRLFNLLCLSARSTAACVEVLPSWSKSESHLLVEQIEILYQGEQETKQEEIDKDLAIVLEILPFAKTVLQNSAMELMDFLKATDEKNGGISDDMSLRRLPVWYKQMTDAGYPSQVIHSWCTSLVFSKNLSSGEVDALTNLTPETIKFITKETDYIGKSLFSKDAPQTWKTKDALIDQKNTEYFKRCLLLARLVNEYFLIAHQLKDNEDVVQKIKDGTQELCRIFEDENAPTGKIYKSRDNLLNELFVLLFSETKDKKSMTQLMKLEPLSKSLVLLLRRLARSVVKRPNTFDQINMVLSNIQKSCDENLSPSQQYHLVQSILHEKVLSLDQNQACIYLLEASGYNKSTAHKENLWRSSSIQMSAYVPTTESVEKNRLVRLMRQLWGEWRIILSENNTHEVEVNGRRAKTAEMFRYSDSLEEMEAQLEAAKKFARLLPEDNWSTYRSRELIRREKAMRAKIRRQAEEVEKTNGKPGQLKLTKATIVWENRLLETIKMCSEKIPGCYAPNGFHSEKPVICGIAVDNRILTLYKEDHGGTRTEMENVEVKLYPAGMVVFGAYRSIHPHDTEQMWAAFYKMLLDKRLVPKIFITNVSPAFYWIKQFVTPETSRPERNFSLLSSCHLIPTSEDSYDYDPDICIHRLHTLQSNDYMKELIILTEEKAKRMQIRNIKPPNRNKLIHDEIDKVVLHLQDDGGLKEMHPKSHDKILDRLKFAIRQAVEIAVDGGKPTQESISESIDMKRLLHRCEDGHQYSKDDYSSVILDAVNTVTGDLQGSRQRSYDGCQHVVFFQPNENRMKID
ncbi:uncharacterized protein LOC116300189 [Actinia tenebrosa]|uniref:Uncharacterized protein LOC116300189 n=1 Tax=Actinia tenebrosa TaxID=6105 RepID=A0A6P8IBU4_ACTTE|nr:uncharacterized protein LOC116300189 [Actinia tenebrosa]XP_031564857.1 uncharacterized protein LOC116300189 [Actinia tenebrosa]